MKTITLKCPVTVKSKATDVLKEQLVAEIKEAMAKVDMELQQIEFHAKRLMTEQVRSDVQGLTALRQQIDGEKQKRLELKNHLQEKMKETSQLELGAGPQLEYLPWSGSQLAVYRAFSLLCIGQ